MGEQRIGAWTGDVVTTGKCYLQYVASQEENDYDHYGFRGVVAFFLETRQGGVTK